MSDSDLAVSDTVVIRCHACGSSEDADATAVTGGESIVCRKCGETWPVARGRSKRRCAVDLVTAAPSAYGRSFHRLEAERVPLIRYSDGLSKAWAAKIDGDVLPDDERRSRLPSAAAAVAACLLLTLFVAGRERAVAAAPDLARLYAAVGLPVNLAGLEIGKVAAERTAGGDGDARILLRGTIRSVGRTEQSLPEISARLYAIDGSAAGVRIFAPPARTIGAGEEMPFETELESVPAKAAEIVLRFRRPEEPLAMSKVESETR